MTWDGLRQLASVKPTLRVRRLRNTQSELDTLSVDMWANTRAHFADSICLCTIDGTANGETPCSSDMGICINSQANSEHAAGLASEDRVFFCQRAPRPRSAAACGRLGLAIARCICSMTHCGAACERAPGGWPKSVAV